MGPFSGVMGPFPTPSNGTANGGAPYVPVTNSSTNYLLGPSDVGNLIIGTAETSATYQVPAIPTAGINDGDRFLIYNLSNSHITLMANTGATLVSPTLTIQSGCMIQIVYTVVQQRFLVQFMSPNNGAIYPSSTITANGNILTPTAGPLIIGGNLQAPNVVQSSTPVTVNLTTATPVLAYTVPAGFSGHVIGYRMRGSTAISNTPEVSIGTNASDYNNIASNVVVNPGLVTGNSTYAPNLGVSTIAEATQQIFILPTSLDTTGVISMQLFVQLLS